MKILISNDDGINSKGVHILVKLLNDLGHEIVVACPSKQCSGYGQSITTRNLITYKQTDQFVGAIKAYAIDGSPTDCILVALNHLLNQKPDLIMTGINHGANVGKDYFYSGTIGAAREGSCNGIASIALSLSRDSDYSLNFEQSIPVMKEVLKKVLSRPLSNGSLTNINFPSRSYDNYLGIKVVPMELRQERFKLIPVDIKDVRATRGFWLSNRINEMDEVQHADYSLVSKGYVTVSPIDIFKNDHELLKEVEEVFKEQ
ncbi:5'/3'-nucleotidase SurE [Facklamia hominis]|uniref:5'-nucleotidase SurE n=1 Tax=Facklamia hominis TaxID=178214 RepID=A0AAJ1Q6I2_9LACT|nr:5'/3'-nucleotidase SurE [Facklamia hominis]